MISGSIIGLKLHLSVLGSGSGDSMPVPKSLSSCSDNALFIIIKIVDAQSWVHF